MVRIIKVLCGELTMNDDKFKRVKYLRALEKFNKSIVLCLKKNEFDEAKFESLVKKNTKILSDIEPVYLDQPYSKALCEFINLAINCKDKAVLLRAANNLDRLKRQKNYKKEKHKAKINEY